MCYNALAKFVNNVLQMSLTNNFGGEKMEDMKHATIARLMFEQSGEEVDVESIVKVPEKAGANPRSPHRHDVYVARTESYTCLVYFYSDGKVHIYVH